MTLGARSQPPADFGRLGARAGGEFRADGRWARLLNAMGPRPMTVAQLLAGTDPGRYPVWRERRKIRRALKDMAALGLVRSSGWGWIRTEAGARAHAVMTIETPVRTPVASAVSTFAPDRSGVGAHPTTPAQTKGDRAT